MRFLLLLALLAATTASAQTSHYALVVPPSDYEIGCFGPCDCAVTSQPTYGSFDLVPTGFDGLYDTYRVERYIASFNDGPGAVALTGGGTFRIGGEVAYMQQMTLDLETADGKRFHVDSGLVPVRATFPKIEVTCPAHAFACYDTVVTVGGAPIGTVDVPPGVTPPAILRVMPNPFASATSIQLALDPARPARVTVLDASGRIVRRLPAGESIRWDGTNDAGARAIPGIYWLRVAWPGGADTRRLVRL